MTQNTPGLQIRTVDFFGWKCHLGGLCSHKLMGAAPTLCRAVLLVPWSATPLLGSSHCLCQKPVGVEPCQNVNLEVAALSLGNSERLVFKIYNPNHDVFTHPSAFTDSPRHQSLQNANFSTSPSSPHFTERMVQSIGSLHHLKGSIRFYTDLFCLSVNLGPCSRLMPLEAKNAVMWSFKYCSDWFP